MKKYNLDSLLDRYDSLEDQNEENIKIKIVYPLFVLLGYNEENFHFEYPTYEGRKKVDISIYNKDRSNFLFIEVKNGEKDLTDRDCIQLTNYMNTQNIEWGVLTNGNCYILFNNSISGTSTEKEVLRCYLKPPSNRTFVNDLYVAKFNSNNMMCLTYDFLYLNKCTYYFKNLTEFKNSFNKKYNSNDKGSFRQYKSILYGFINYIIDKYKSYDLSFISPYALNNFLLEDIKKKKISNQRYTESIETIVNKYNYIKGFCETLKNNRQILSNPFENLNEEKILSDFSLSSKENNYKLLEDGEIIEILNSYKSENNSLRNSLIFLLFLYTGLDIKEIKNLKDNDVNINSKVIYVNNRSIPLTNNILDLLKKYKNYKKINKINCEFLFYSKYRGKYNKLNDVSFNRIISLQAFKTNLDSERKKLITPSFIKESLIKKMFKNGFTIEEIKYLTGLSLTSIGNYITDNDIANKVELKNFYRRHPYKAFF